MREYFLRSTEPNYSVFRRHISVPSILQNWGAASIYSVGKRARFKMWAERRLGYAAPAPVTDLMKKSLQKFQTGESTYFVNLNTTICMYLYSLMWKLVPFRTLRQQQKYLITKPIHRIFQKNKTDGSTWGFSYIDANSLLVNWMWREI
jgi:hypothetical protein